MLGLGASVRVVTQALGSRLREHAHRLKILHRRRRRSLAGPSPMSRYYKNPEARIAKLKAHLRSRRGRRDLVALGTLADIAHWYKTKGLTERTLNDLLKHIYTDELCSPDRAYMVNPTFAFLRKEHHGKGLVSVVSGIGADPGERAADLPGRHEAVADEAPAPHHSPEQEPRQDGAPLRGLGQGRMSHIEDDDLPIRSKTSQAYRDNYDRIFGEEPALKTGENTEDVADAPLPAQTPAEAVKEYLANGGEPSPIGWYGVVNVETDEERRHLAECESLATEGADCNCGEGNRYTFEK